MTRFKRELYCRERLTMRTWESLVDYAPGPVSVIDHLYSSVMQSKLNFELFDQLREDL